MIVDTSSVGGVNLKIRETPGVNSKIKDRLPNGTEIYVTKQSLENPKEADGFQWVAVFDGNDTEKYCALEYLKEESELSNDIANQDNMIVEMIVDTSSSNYVNLKVREKPGINSIIKRELLHGQKIYVIRESLENTIKANGLEWGKVVYEDGETGFVAIKYLKQIDKSEELITDNPVLNDPQDTRIKMIVDTSSVRNADLKLREAPGTDAKIKMNLQDGTTVYTTQRFIDEAEQSKKINGHKWIQVIAENGEMGYVAYEYIVKEEIREEPSSDRKIEYRNFTIPGRGNLEGVLILDSVELSIGEFEKVLNGEGSIPSKYGKKPEGIMIKIGATGWGSQFSFATKEEGIKKAQALMELCEKNKIPYGTYYFTQAINEEEQQAEIDFILNVFSGMGELKYNVLGLAIDIENGEKGYSRMSRFSEESQENRQYLTKLKKDMMKELREKTGKEVIIYSNRHALKQIIDYTQLGEEDLNRLWLVNHSAGGHVNDLEKMGILEDSSFWQVELDLELDRLGGVDLSVMTTERFNELLKNGDIEIVFDNTERNEER